MEGILCHLPFLHKTKNKSAPQSKGNQQCRDWKRSQISMLHVTHIKCVTLNYAKVPILLSSKVFSASYIYICIYVHHKLIVLICHKNGKNPLLFQFIRNAIEWTVIIIDEFHSCLLHINFF